MSASELFGSWQDKATAATSRPALMGTRHMVSAGHYLAAHAAFRVLEAGGNAIDAGCAAGIALGVLQPNIVQVSGVAPIMIYRAAQREVTTISGLGTWPKAASAEFFRSRHGGVIPRGLLRSIVPGAPAAWILALQRFGTMGFGEIAADAIRFAGEGFATDRFLAGHLAEHAPTYAKFPSSAAVYLPNGRSPAPGDVFVQADVARMLGYMVEEERKAAARGGREAGLSAAHDAFYKRDIAATIARFYQDNGGLLTQADLAGFMPAIEAPVMTRLGDVEIYTCGPWCQGPALAQAVSLLEPSKLAALGHNSVDYVHVLTEALKLAFADRERHYGDPRFVDVPIDGLLSDEYAAKRRALIRMDRAWPEMPPAGDPLRGLAETPWTNLPPAADMPSPSPRDTSYVCVVDRWGNVFSATPSDSSSDGVVVPGTGFVVSTRGTQSWTEAGHPSSVEGGKRPRLTPNPAIAIRPGHFTMPFGTPGGDVQIQAMLQVLLNIVLFGMDPQAAVEAPRFATASFPDSFTPHPYYPGRLDIEQRLLTKVGDELAARGHRLQSWPDNTWKAGAVCTIVADHRRGVLAGGADPRRPTYALGW